MTLPASGQLGMGQIMQEVYLSATEANANLQEQTVRYLAGKSAGEQISFADLYNKTYSWENAVDWGSGTYTIAATTEADQGAPSSEVEAWFRETGYFEIYEDNVKGSPVRWTPDREWHHSPGSDWAAYGDDFYIKWDQLSGDTVAANVTQSTWANMNTTELNIGFTNSTLNSVLDGTVRITIRYSNVVDTEISQDFRFVATYSESLV